MEADYGPPKDVPGQCNARLYLVDDYGDNECTLRCHRPFGHTGHHREEFIRENIYGEPHSPGHPSEPGPARRNHVTVEWDLDEREDAPQIDDADP